jgi:hypothetical protein
LQQTNERYSPGTRARTRKEYSRAPTCRCVAKVDADQLPEAPAGIPIFNDFLEFSKQTPPKLLRTVILISINYASLAGGSWSSGEKSAKLSPTGKQYYLSPAARPRALGIQLVRRR